VSRQRVHFYDPTTRAGRALNEDLKTLFVETREKAKQDLDSVPSYHKAIRLQRITNVEGLVMRSVQTGRDLGQLTTDLQEQFGVTRRRAAFIARHQSNKATASMTRASG
jgi:uncharacterized protein with gpF-like domain